jgi:hypothetical protein
MNNEVEHRTQAGRFVRENTNGRDVGSSRGQCWSEFTAPE